MQRVEIRERHGLDPFMGRAELGRVTLLIIPKT